MELPGGPLPANEEEALQRGGYAMLAYCDVLLKQVQQDRTLLPHFQRFVYAMLHEDEINDPGGFHALAQAAWCYEQLGLIKQAMWCCQRGLERGVEGFAVRLAHLQAVQASQQAENGA